VAETIAGSNCTYLRRDGQPERLDLMPGWYTREGDLPVTVLIALDDVDVTSATKPATSTYVYD